MAKIFNIDLTEDECLDFAYEAAADNDLKKSLFYVHKTLELNPDNIEANFYLASIYSDLSAFAFSNDVIFKTLPKIKDKTELDRFYILLGANFSTLGDFDLATHYATQIDFDSELMAELGEAFDIEVVENQPRFYLAYPKGEEYYAERLERARDLLNEKEVGQALEILEEFKEGTPYKDKADHLKLLCFMLRDDFDSIIYFAEDMLKTSKNKIPIKCMLITALMFEGKTKEANEKLDELLAEEQIEVEDLSVVLPLMVNMKRHDKVVEYCLKFNGKHQYHPSTLMWLSQGYYNLGQKDMALKVMKEVYEIYRDYLPAQYYINYYKSGIPEVEYSLGLPLMEYFNRQTRIKNFLLSKTCDAKNAYLYDKEINDVIRWSFKEGNVTIVLALIIKLGEFYQKDMDELFYDIMHSDKIVFQEIVEIVKIYLLNKSELDFSLCVNGVLKEIYAAFPVQVKYLPPNALTALANAITDIIYEFDDSNERLEKLIKVLNEHLKIEDDRAGIGLASYDKLKKMKSLKTMVGTFLVAVGEDKNEIFERLDLNKVSFAKYMKTIFGDKKNGKQQ